MSRHRTAPRGDLAERSRSVRPPAHRPTAGGTSYTRSTRLIDTFLNDCYGQDDALAEVRRVLDDEGLAGWTVTLAEDFPDGLDCAGIAVDASEQNVIVAGVRPQLNQNEINGMSCGVGGSYAIFEGSYHYRLVFFTTPVDDEVSDMFYSIWWPRDEVDTSPAARVHHQEAAQKEFLSTLWDDLEIWRYQVYVETPAFAKQDAKPYGALRKWARQFYELEPA